VRAARGWSLAVLVGLIVVALVVTLLALRPASPPAAPPLLASTAAVATEGDQVWVWYGVTACRSGSTSTPAAAASAAVSIAHYDGHQWQTAQTPLASVTSLTFSSTRRGVATGPLTDCSPGTITTTDGGATWDAAASDTGASTSAPGTSTPSTSTPSTSTLDVSLAGPTLWTVAGSGRARVGRSLLSASGQLSDQQMTQPTDPCRDAGSPPSLVAAVSATTALLLCQNVGADERHVLRTTSSGLAWEVLVDQRPQTGFDGSGVSVIGLSAAGPQLAWALFADPQGECPEGQLRRSDDGGLTWTRLPCPNQSAPVDNVLAMDFGSITQGSTAQGSTTRGSTTRGSTAQGVLVGMSGARPTVLVSTDGGQEWRAIAPPPAL
jgi:hypothetical protein